MALTDEFRAVLGEPSRRARRLGVEQEYAVWDGARLVDFGVLIESLAIPGRRVHPLDPKVYRTPSGLALLADGDVAEVASPPLSLEPGFGANVAAWADHGRQVLHTVMPGGLRLEGGSTHLSVEVDPDDCDEIALRYVTTYAPALMLLLDRADSPGLLVRPRPGRVELCGEYAEGDQLRAAVVFAAGSVLAATCRISVPVVDLVVEPGRRRWGWYVDRAAVGADLYESGRATPLRLVGGGTVTAQVHLEHCWQAARRALSGLASRADLACVDAVVSSRAPLPSTQPSAPERPQPRPMPAPIAGRAVEGRVLEPRHRPGFDVDVSMATWDFAAFTVRTNDRDAVACVPHDRLDRFLHQLDGGALDGVLRAYLTTPPAPPRVLAQAGQTTEPGLYDTVAASAALLPADRVGVGAGAADPVRPGKIVEPIPTFVADEPHHTNWWWPWLPIVVVLLVITSTLLIVTFIGDDDTTDTATTPTPPPTPPAAVTTDCGEGLQGPVFDNVAMNEPCTYTSTQLTGGGDPYDTCTDSACTTVATEIPIQYTAPCSFVDHFPDVPATDPVTGESGPSRVGFVGLTSAPPGTVFRIHMTGAFNNNFTGDGTAGDNGVVQTFVSVDNFGPWTVDQFSILSSSQEGLAGLAFDPTLATPGGQVLVTQNESTCDTAGLATQGVLLRQLVEDFSDFGALSQSLRIALGVLSRPGSDFTLREDTAQVHLDTAAVDLSPPTPIGLRWIPGGVPTVHSAAGIPGVIPEGPTRLRWTGGAMVDPTSGGTADVWFDNTVFPCGPGQVALTVCAENGAEVDDGAFVMVAAVLDGAVPLGDPTNFYSYGFAFDGDANPATGYVPIADFPNDFFTGADRFYSADYDPDAGWTLRAGASPGPGQPQDVVSGARVMIRNNALVLLVPASEFDVPNPSVRVTTFRHGGDFGLGADNDWSGDVEPAVGAGFAALGPDHVTIAPPADEPGSTTTTTTAGSTTTTTTAPVEDPVAFISALQQARRSGDTTFLFDRLHPAVLDRYGAAACQAYVATIAVPDITYTVSSVEGPMPWDWIADGLTRTIDGTFFASATVSTGTTTADTVVHVTPVDTEMRYFTDCGDPLPDAP